MASQQLQCAENDDTSMLESLYCTQKDSNGKCLIDYVLERKSEKVFSELVKNNYKELFEYLFPKTLGQTANQETVDDLIYLCLITNNVQIMEQCPVSEIYPHGIKSMLPAQDKEDIGSMPGPNNIQLKNRCILTERCFKTIANPSKVTDETFDYIISPFSNPKPELNETNDSCWIYGLPYVIDKCYEINQSDRLEKALCVVEKSNKISSENYNNNKNKRTIENGYYKRSVQLMQNDRNAICSYGFTRILKSTFDMALSRGDFNLLERFKYINNTVKNCGFNAYMISDEEERISLNSRKKLLLHKTFPSTNLIEAL